MFQQWYIPDHIQRVVQQYAISETTSEFKQEGYGLIYTRLHLLSNLLCSEDLKK